MLLAFVNDMAERAQGVSVSLCLNICAHLRCRKVKLEARYVLHMSLGIHSEVVSQEFELPEQLLQNKSRKKLAARFNSKPKLGLAFLEENKLIYSDLSPEVSREKSSAKFLKGSVRLDKRLLGDYLSKPDNVELLREFMNLFDFKDVNCFSSPHIRN
jgi:Sec7 domain